MSRAVLTLVVTAVALAVITVSRLGDPHEGRRGAQATAPSSLVDGDWSTPPPARPVERSVVYSPPTSGDGWVRLGVTSAHAAMVVRVAIDAGVDPAAVAAEIVESVGAIYAEILIYFHEPGRDGAMPHLRIQWTPARGYVATRF